MNKYIILISRDRLFPETNVRNVIFQLLQGLAYMHKLGNGDFFEMSNSNLRIFKDFFIAI